MPNRISSLIFIAPVFLAGCLTFSGKQMPKIEEPIAPPNMSSVEVTVGEFVYRVDGGQMATSYRRGKILNERLMGIWKNRSYIKSYKNIAYADFTGDADYEITLLGKIYMRSPIVMQVISGLTLFVIPHVNDTRIDIGYSMKETRTKKKFTSNLKDNYKTVSELLFLPVTPFSAVGKRKMYGTMAGHLYSDFQKQGAFQ